MTNVVCVVTRYFGGILLGTGGLTRAYTDAAVAVVQNSNILTMEKGAVCRLQCSYAEWSKIQKLFSFFNATIISSVFTDSIEVKFTVYYSEIEELFHQIYDKTLGKVTAYIDYENYMPL